MTLGKGDIHPASCKQMLNTKSSTEAVLVANDDAIGQVLWTRHFLAMQGMYLPTKTIYQESKAQCNWQKMEKLPAADGHNT